MVFKLCFGICACIQRGGQETTSFVLWGFVSLAARVNYPNIYTCLIFLESTRTAPPPPPREGQTHYTLPQPLFLRTATHERPRPSMCLNGEESSDTFPEVLVLEIPAFQFQCAECRSPILTAIDPLSSCSLKCGLWTSSIKHHPRAC